MFRKVYRKFKDMIDGSRVVLYERDFIAIRDGVGHSQPHAEIETHIDYVRAAVENPHVVNMDRIKPGVDCHYAQFPGDLVYPPGYMKVVVRKTLYAKVVINAYFESHISGAETRVWPIKTKK